MKEEVNFQFPNGFSHEKKPHTVWLTDEVSFNSLTDSHLTDGRLGGGGGTSFNSLTDSHWMNA